MNCEQLPLWLSAAVDGELAPAEASAMQQHLAGCPSCRDEWIEWQGLHHDLRVALPVPSGDPVIKNVLQAISGRTPGMVANVAQRRRQVPNPSSRNSAVALLAVASSLVIAAVFVVRLASATPAIAEIAMATGPIEIKPANSSNWIAADGKSRVHLAADSRVRTPSNSLCEIHTKADAVVRLNEATELVLRRSELVELVTGELWCRAPETTGIKIRGAASSIPVGTSPIFTCPSSTEMQWRAVPDLGLTCVDVDTAAVKIESAQTSRTIEPGECVTFASDSARVAQSQRTDPFQATSWQLPLLALRDPLDVELQDRLQRVLAVVGKSKAAYFYEDQIRRLGPAGALPLLAYVRSPDSRRDSDLRIRAMHFVVELAAPATLPQLQELLDDDDPVVKSLAAQTISRLRSRPPGQE